MSRGDHVRRVLGDWRREAPSLDRSAFAVVGRVSRLAQLLGERLEPVFAQHGLTSGEFDVLAALRRAGRPYRLTPTELGTALIVTSGGMTKRLNALEDRGLVRRLADPHDRRSRSVVLTPKGSRLVSRVLADHAANESRLVSGLSMSERRQLAALLEKLAVTLGDEPEGPLRRPRRR